MENYIFQTTNHLAILVYQRLNSSMVDGPSEFRPPLRADRCWDSIDPRHSTPATDTDTDGDRMGVPHVHGEGNRGNGEMYMKMMR